MIGSRYHQQDGRKTAIFTSDLKGNCVSTLVSPIGGDTSYPGMIVHRNYLWVMYYSSHRFNHLLISHDKGLTWQYAAPVAVDDEVVFSEASVYETPKGGYGDLLLLQEKSNQENRRQYTYSILISVRKGPLAGLMSSFIIPSTRENQYPKVPIRSL